MKNAFHWINNAIKEKEDTGKSKMKNKKRECKKKKEFTEKKARNKWINKTRRIKTLNGIKLFGIILKITTIMFHQIIRRMLLIRIDSNYCEKTQMLLKKTQIKTYCHIVLQRGRRNLSAFQYIWDFMSYFHYQR